jgi:hypothetical protein
MEQQIGDLYLPYYQKDKTDEKTKAIYSANIL